MVRNHARAHSAPCVRPRCVCVFVVFLRAHVQFWCFDMADATADVQSPTATLIPPFSSSGHTGCVHPGLLDWKNRSECVADGSSCVNGEHPIFKLGALLVVTLYILSSQNH